MKIKQKFFIYDESIKSNAIEMVKRLEPMNKNPYIVEIKPATRKLIQNNLMWVLLGKIAKRIKWPVTDENGITTNEYLSDQDWKGILSASLQGASRRVQDPNGNGMVLLGHSTSTESIEWMSNMIELCYAFAAQQGVNLDA